MSFFMALIVDDSLPSVYLFSKRHLGASLIYSGCKIIKLEFKTKIFCQVIFSNLSAQKGFKIYLKIFLWYFSKMHRA